jgi:hypothetical protein
MIYGGDHHQEHSSSRDHGAYPLGRLRDADDVGSNVRGALKTSSKDEEFINMTLAV